MSGRPEFRRVWEKCLGGTENLIKNHTLLGSGGFHFSLYNLVMIRLFDPMVYRQFENDQATQRKRAIAIEEFADTSNGKMMSEAARNCRFVFFTGLPASGKSFLLRELISMTVSAGRRVQIIRWDTGLAAFSTDEILASYPDVEDGSHPIIRLAAGLWGRQAIARWFEEHPDPVDILIGEVPIIGNRFSEFIAVRHDAIEPILNSEITKFFYPVPSREIRRKLETIRRETFSNPKHPDEAKDAPPATMDHAWRLTFRQAIQLGLIPPRENLEQPEYNGTIYRRFFDHLLQHRNAQGIDIDRFYGRGGSAHDLESGISELIATPDEVAMAISCVKETMSAEEAAYAITKYYQV